MAEAAPPGGRAPCPRCGELVALAGAFCPHCNASLLVDLLAVSPARSERTAYTLARHLKELWPELDLVATKRGLETATSALATGVTRDQALQIAEELAAGGVPTQTIPHGGGTGQPSLTGWFETLRERPLIPAVVLAGALLLTVAILSGGDASDGDGAVDAARERPNSPRLVEALSSREIADRALPAMVSLRCSDSMGSGFLITDQLVATNAHVLCSEGDGEIEVVFADGRRTNAKTVRQDRRLDVALVQLPNRGQASLTLGDATTLRRGDEVLIFGNPRGLDFTLSRGIVSHNARNVMGVLYVQVDANINPGNSGGPLFDSSGRAVGIVSMTVGEETGLGLALPINYLYEGPRPFLPRPLDADSDGWRTLLSQISTEDRREASELTEIYDQPALAQAIVASGNSIVAVVLRRFPAVPNSEKYFFVFRDHEALVCSAIGEVNEWHQIDDRDVSGLDERTKQWAQEHGLLAELHAGAAKLSLERCPPSRQLLGLDLWIEDGDPRAQHTVVASDPNPFGW